MRKLFLLFVLISCYANSQEIHSEFKANELLTTNDFKLADGRMLVTDQPCKIHDTADVHEFQVSVICQSQMFRQFGVEKINDMIVFANSKVQRVLSIEQEFIPKEIKMAYNPEIKAWSMTNLFEIKDQSGEIQKNLLTLDFDSTGKFLKMQRIF